MKKKRKEKGEKIAGKKKKKQKKKSPKARTGYLAVGRSSRLPSWRWDFPPPPGALFTSPRPPVAPSAGAAQRCRSLLALAAEGGWGRRGGALRGTARGCAAGWARAEGEEEEERAQWPPRSPELPPLQVAAAAPGSALPQYRGGSNATAGTCGKRLVPGSCALLRPALPPPFPGKPPHQLMPPGPMQVPGCRKRSPVSPLCRAFYISRGFQNAPHGLWENGLLKQTKSNTGEAKRCFI